MPLELPKPVAEYFAAEMAHDAHALARCFVDDGVVHDEGGTFRGTTAIRDWNAGAQEKYHHTVTPLSVVDRDGTTIVAGRVLIPKRLGECRTIGKVLVHNLAKFWMRQA